MCIQGGVIYWRIKLETRAGLASAKEEEVDSIFPSRVFQFYLVTKGFLTCLNEQFKYSIIDHLNLNEINTLLI